MKQLTIIYVLLLSCFGLSAQGTSKSAYAEPVKKDGPQLFNTTEEALSPRTRRLVSPDEVSLALFNSLEIRASYQEFLTYKDFYSSRQADGLWKSTQNAIFSDRQPIDGRSKCENILKLYPEAEAPATPPKFSYINALRETMGEDLHREFSFCLSYIGLEYLDKEIWDAYVSREVELIKEMKMLPSKNLRLKGLMLAVDFQIKVCQVEPGFSQKIK
jgi:hypothetical protein